MSNKYYSGPKSDHFDGAYFYNPWDRFKHSWWDVLRWKLTASPKPWPEPKKLATETPLERVEGSDLIITFIGHASLLIQTEGLNILTDPNWADWASPLHSKRMRRMQPPGVLLENLPKIDLVCLSHNHYDHLDIETIRLLWQKDQPKIVTPLGNDTILRSKIPSIAVTALDWNESVEMGAIKVHLQPAQHWSSRNLWDRNNALWGSFVFETAHGNVFFAGDTGYGEFFHSIKAQFGSFRLAILPIGAYEPRWFMKYAHMNPEDAVQAYIDLGRPYCIGMHFGTFRLTDEGIDEPLKDLAAASQSHKVPEDRFRTLEVGKSWRVPLT